MKLGFDLDGVISNTVDKTIEIFNKRFNKNLSTDAIKTFNLSDNEYDEDIEKNKKFALKFIECINDPEVQAECKPYSDAASSLRKIKSYGHTIHIITSRPKENYNSTIEWLRKHKIPYNSAHIIGSADKGMFGRLLNLDMYVDDFEPNLESMWKYKKRWRKGLLLLDRTWNDGYLDVNKFKRVYNWDDVVRHLGIQNR
jgi:uncharacterized HAD superfamily protein